MQKWEECKNVKCTGEAKAGQASMNKATVCLLKRRQLTKMPFGK